MSSIDISREDIERMILDAMEEYSHDNCAGWLADVEHIVYESGRHGAETGESCVARAHRLARSIGGWMADPGTGKVNPRWGGCEPRDKYVFVPLAEWDDRHREWLDRQLARQRDSDAALFVELDTPSAPAPTPRRSLRCQFTFTMLSALHHGQGTEGNVSLFRTGRFIVDGEPQDVPYVTGNAIKHVVIREPGVRHMLRVLEVPDGSLSKAAVHLLWSGGALTTKGSAIDLGAYRAICEHIPVLSLCGGALGNFMAESRISVGDARPVCAEHADRIDPSDAIDSRLLRVPVGHLYDVQMGTRHDPLRQQEVQRYLTAGEMRLLEDGKREALAKREAKEHTDKGDSQQMIYERQVLAAGTQLVCRVYTKDLTEIEEAALWAAVNEWMRLPFIGAGKAVGNGEAALTIQASEPIALRYPEWRRAELPPELGENDGAARAMHARYETHLREHRRDILGALGRLS